MPRPPPPHTPKMTFFTRIQPMPTHHSSNPNMGPDVALGDIPSGEEVTPDSSVRGHPEWYQRMCARHDVSTAARVAARATAAEQVSSQRKADRPQSPREAFSCRKVPVLVLRGDSLCSSRDVFRISEPCSRAPVGFSFFWADLLLSVWGEQFFFFLFSFFMPDLACY